MEDYDDGFFQWSRQKENLNIAKHGVSFAHASEIFDDPCLLEQPDTEHSWDADRWIALGRASDGSIMTIVWVSRNSRI